MTHVFISYCRKDTGFVEKLEHELTASKMGVIYDWTQQ